MKAKQTNNWAAALKKNIRHYITLTFIPHATNQYQPHLIRWYGLGTLLVIIIAFQVGYNVSTSGMVLGEKTSITPDALLIDTNDERSSHQIDPLIVNKQLSHAALLKAQDMFQKQYWAHTAPDGTTPWRWFGAVGYDYSYAGENLAKNFHTVEAVMTAWMASPEHQANILDAQYSQVGFAVVDGTLNGKMTTLVVALYGASATIGSVASAQVTGNAPAARSMGLLTRFGVAVQSMAPALLGSLMLILAGSIIGLIAHVHRAKLPKALARSWYRHHGLMKASGMLSFIIIILFLYSGGQI